MKKFFAVLIALVVAVGANVCSANYYDDDPNWYYFMTWQGASRDYLYLPSIDVQEYNPPHYQISGKCITVRLGLTQNDIIKTLEYMVTIRYNWHTKEAFRYKNGNLEKMCQQPSNMSTPYRFDRALANALFRAAYGMKFYD